MIDLYREFAVPVDPEFTRALKAQLDARRVRPHGPPDASSVDDRSIQIEPTTEVTLVLKPAKNPDHRWRRVGLIAAAVVAVVAAGTVLMLVTGDDDAGPRPADTLPPENSAPATVTPTTAPSTSLSPATVAPSMPPSTAQPASVDPPSASADRQFAAAVALTPDDWGANYSVDPETVRWRMTRELAETLPECAPFLDTVFESPGRPATVTTAMATTFTWANWQYVVVFPDVTGAETMMDALHDPRYPECDARYRSAYWAWMGFDVNDNFGIGVPPQLDLAGDDSVVVDVTESFLRDGHQTIPFVRAGRTVMMFDAPYYDDDELVVIVNRAVERVSAAEAGTPLASVSLPLSYLAKAVIPTGSELGEGWSAVPSAPDWKLDRSAGSSLPSCAAFVDVFLSGQTSSLGYDSETFAIDPQAVATAGGVIRVMAIAYARQQAAEAAMDAISNPDFSRCLADYTSAEPPNDAWQTTTREPITATGPSPLGDESVSLAFEGSYTGPDGTTSPAGPIVDVFIRVDQVLIGMEVTLDHMSTDEMEQVLEQLVERAEAAIIGAPIPPR